MARHVGRPTGRGVSEIGEARLAGRGSGFVTNSSGRMDQNDVFVIAVKRERRDAAPRDWMETVRGTSGVTVLGEASEARLQVRATAEAIAGVRDLRSEYLHIERRIPHNF